MKSKHSEDGFSLDGCTTREDIANRRDMIRNVARHQGRARFTDEALRELRSFREADVAAFGMSEAPEFRTRRVRHVAAFRLSNDGRRFGSQTFLRHFFATPTPFGSIFDYIDGAALDTAMAHDERPKSADIHTLIRLSMRRG